PILLDGRKLRVEFGSAEAARRGAPWIHDPKGLNTQKAESRKRDYPEDEGEDHEAEGGGGGGRRARRRERHQGVGSGPRSFKSGPSSAPTGPPPGPERASAAVVPFTGTKITFDDE
ncbi:hypothetical protein BJ684DRAFT_21223, partial [Piptocephalis cylindrospora]